MSEADAAVLPAAALPDVAAAIFVPLDFAVAIPAVAGLRSGGAEAMAAAAWRSAGVVGTAAAEQPSVAAAVSVAAVVQPFVVAVVAVSVAAVEVDSAAAVGEAIGPTSG
jgi:hypothetical protein